MLPHFDKVDARLVALLQENGRIAQNDLARAVGLSAPAVAERLRKLEERGLVRGYTALLDARLLGLDLLAFIFVGIGGSRHHAGFRARAAEMAEVQECHSITGQGSHVLKVRVANSAALEELLAEVQSWPGVQWTQTSIVLSTVKETSHVPVPHPVEEAEEGRSGAESPIPADLLHVPFRHHP